MEWKPRTLKIRYFPMDDCDISAMSQELQDRGLIELYEVDGKTYAEIPSFKKHQVINNREADSSLPARVKVASKRVPAEGRKEGKGKEGKEPPSATRFDDFWAAWPKSDRKQDKAKCQERWAALGLDDIADKVSADVEFKKLTRKWQDDDGKFIEAPLVYLNNRRWEDDSGAAPKAANPAFAGML
jgi:hypothetical protein